LRPESRVVSVNGQTIIDVSRLALADLGAWLGRLRAVLSGTEMLIAAPVLNDLSVRVARLVAVHDVGRAINPPSTLGQIQGAVLMGVGTALSEEYVPGVPTGLTDYVLPMIGAVPEVQVVLVEVPSYYGPLGAKGVGEAAILPTAPAIVNGISRAIGVRIRRLPATPPRVLDAIKSKQV
ncbi:MAG: molybdopterin-dependent oxidoreductase, partial [Chloroflexi bacterium]|nr:molybdopterin-dependent oxidoreductase [Chloroflexota bacterium]